VEVTSEAVIAIVASAGAEPLERNATARERRLAEKRPIENWAIAAIVVASAVVAWVHIRATTIWYDEALTLLISSGHGMLEWSLGMQQFKPTANLLRILTELYKFDVHPPLYFWTLALWRVVFGASLEAARAMSLVFTLGTLLLLYRYGMAVGMRWASFPVIIYAVSAAGLRYAYNARPYAMATFLIVLTLFLARQRSRWTGVCAAACVASHYFGALCVGPVLAVECWLSWKTDRRWSVWTAFSFAAFCSPLVLLVTKHVGARPHQFPGFGNFRNEVDALLFAAMKGAMPGATIARAWRVALAIGGVFAGAGSLWALRRKLATVPLAYAGFLCGFLLLSMVTHKSIAKMPNDYYLGIGAPLLALLMGYGASAYPLASPLLAAALVAGTVTTTPMMMPPSNYRTMLNHIRGECEHCALVAGGTAVPACLLYEARGLDVFLLNKKDTAEGVAQRVGAGRTMYLFPDPDSDATTKIEKEIVSAFPSVAEEGYFKITTPSTSAK
jgi:Dolichyl-phosphate-mannose-protein mannosyltransferase